MRLFIAEKPELGRAIAGALDGNTANSNGYIQKGDNIITWAFGHILSLAEPHDYDTKWEKWDLADLPLKIDNFKYKPLPKSKEQLKIICDLIKKKEITEIIHCGDADDEGQILIEEILNYANNHKPVKRLLINDNTEKGVKQALKNIKDNKEFYGLAQRGFARSQADWIVGINLTRAFTTKARMQGYQGVLSLGRVQTPILSMIVNRDIEHENFKSSYYFSIVGTFGISGKIIRANLVTDEKISDENVAIDIKNQSKGKQANITLNTEHKTENPPLPYSLLKLQVDCSKIFGLKPDKTLEITQKLREEYKCITYNRSDCEYLPTTLYEQSSEIIEALKSNFNNDNNISEFISNTNLSIKSIAFNDGNITAHHAIIPTAQSFDITKLNKEQLDVYALITKRFLAQFFPKKEFDSTSLEINIQDNIFKTHQINITKPSFEIFTKSIDENSEDIDNVKNSIDLRELQDGQNTTCQDIEILKKKTNPKPYYTMATLLKDLTGVAKYAKDERIKKLLLEKDKGKKGENGGIGTPATRSAHISNLIDKEYIEVSNDKKQVIKSTKKGRDLISLAPKSLNCVDMTALWFEEQKQIENNELTKDKFLASVTNLVKNEIEEIKSSGMKNFASEYKCPKCGSALIRRESKNKKGSFFWGCANYKNCDIGFIDDEKGKPVFEKKEQAQTSNILCPTCKKGKLERKKNQKGNYWWGCSEWKNGCKAMFYDEDGKPKIS